MKSRYLVLYRHAYGNGEVQHAMCETLEAAELVGRYLVTSPYAVNPIVRIIEERVVKVMTRPDKETGNPAAYHGTSHIPAKYSEE